MGSKPHYGKPILFLLIGLLTTIALLGFHEQLFYKLASPFVDRSENCRADCVTPFGDELGKATEDIAAYSNCNSNCFTSQANKVDGNFTGIKWQCVEFARRWLLKNKGFTFASVDTAADIWPKIASVTRVADKHEFPLQSHVNGSNAPPQGGDLLVYANAYLNTGHVAVITEVDLRSGAIRVAEQNLRNEKWPDNYSRAIPLVVHEGNYWLLDAYLIGWKHIGQ
jgi:hypothetical protein